MKRVLWIMMTAILTLSLVFSFGAVGLAEDNVGWSVTVNPTSLPSEGNVTLNVKVYCKGDPITGIRLTYPGGQVIDMGSLGTGETGSHVNESFFVPDNSFDKDLTFKLDYTSAAGEAKQLSGTMKIAKKAANIKVTGSAKADDTSVKSGEKVTFTFVFKNEGDVKIENATLKCPPIDGGSQIGKAFSLAPGESKTMTYTVTMNSDGSYKPKLSFTAGGANKSLELDTIKIEVEEPEKKSEIKVDLSSDVSEVVAGEIVTFKAVVKNTGEVDIKNLTVVDSSGEQVTLAGDTIKAGGNTTAEFTRAIDQNTDFYVTASGKDAKGDNVSATSNIVTVMTTQEEAAPEELPAAPAEDPNTKKGLIIEVTPGLEPTAENQFTLAEPGPVTFTINVANTSSIVLNNVTVSEQTLGTLATINSMGTTSETIQKSVDIAESGVYRFIVTATRADTGEQVSVAAAGIQINVENEGGGDFMLGIIIVIICAAAGVGVALFFVLKNKNGGGNTPTRTSSARGGNGGYQRTSSARGNGGHSSSRNSRSYEAQSERREAPRKQPAKKAPASRETKYGDRNKF